MSTEAPFNIAVPDATLSALQDKLAHATLPDELDEAGWDYGVPLADIRRLLARWTNGYDWRAQEAALNTELPQFTRDIEVDGFGTLNIHYVHKRSELDSAIPLLFVHGWPGSFLEVRKILPLLTAKAEKDEHPSFHVVALSLPGYGFSEAPRKKGFARLQYAEVANKLMLTLGYDQYVSQGGDWGRLVTRSNASMNGPKHVKAWHTNSAYGGSAPTIWTPLRYLRYLFTPLSASEKAGVERSRWFAACQNGYFQEQSTQPQTLSYALADSPVGLLAWIYEKLVQWTDNYPWEDDEVLTWVSIYLFSRAGPAASLRIYYEVRASGAAANPGPPPSIPFGVSRFPRDIALSPRSWAWSLGNVVFNAEHDRGGHFPAHEQPAALAGDVRAMFSKIGPAFGVVKSKSGYAL